MSANLATVSEPRDSVNALPGLRAISAWNHGVIRPMRLKAGSTSSGRNRFATLKACSLFRFPCVRPAHGFNYQANTKGTKNES